MEEEFYDKLVIDFIFIPFLYSLDVPMKSYRYSQFILPLSLVARTTLTVFPLISAPGAYLIYEPQPPALIRGRRL